MQEAVLNRGVSVTAEKALDEQIADLVAAVRRDQERSAALEVRIDSAKSQLRRLLQQRGANWTDNEGYARLIADGVRVSYPTPALDDLIIKDPLHYGWLKDYRKEVTIRGGVQVK